MAATFGKGMKNNQVVVDYVKKTITFDDSPDKRWAIDLYVSDLMTVLYGWVYVYLVLSLLYVGACVLFFGVLPSDEKLIADSFFSGLVVCLLAQTGKWCSAKWRREKYPKWNALARVIVAQKKPKRYVVNPSAVVGGFFVIRHFSNVMLEYETTQDYTRYLSVVRIENIYKDHPFDWYVVFEFSKPPLLGEMVVTTL